MLRGLVSCPVFWQCAKMLFYDYLLVVHDVDTLNGFLHFTSHEVIYLVGSCGGSVDVTDASVFTLIEQVDNVYKQLVTIYETELDGSLELRVVNFKVSVGNSLVVAVWVLNDVDTQVAHALWVARAVKTERKACLHVYWVAPQA